MLTESASTKLTRGASLPVAVAVTNARILDNMPTVAEAFTVN